MAGSVLCFSDAHCVQRDLGYCRLPCVTINCFLFSHSETNDDNKLIPKVIQKKQLAVEFADTSMLHNGRNHKQQKHRFFLFGRKVINLVSLCTQLAGCFKLRWVFSHQRANDNEI